MKMKITEVFFPLLTAEKYQTSSSLLQLTPCLIIFLVSQYFLYSIAPWPRKIKQEVSKRGPYFSASYYWMHFAKYLTGF